MNRLPLYCLCLLPALTVNAEAGFPFPGSSAQQLETIRNETTSIVLATLHDVRQLSQDEVVRIYGSGFLSDRPAFAYRLKFVETLRGKQRKGFLEVPFSFITLPQEPWVSSTNKQRETLLEGSKALVLVQESKPDEKPRCRVWPVNSFETDQVLFWRKVTAFWNTPDVSERKQALLDGCRNPLPAFQDYCCDRLANWEGGKPDSNAVEQLSRDLALPVIWQLFMDPMTSLEVITTCDEILDRISLGWRHHPARYDVVTNALRRQSQSDAPRDFTFLPWDDYNLLERRLSALSQVPGRSRQTYRLLVEVIESDAENDYWQAVNHLSHLYRPHTTDPQQQQLNEEIWNRLAAGVASGDSKRVGAASSALYQIASDHACTGGIPARVTKVLGTDASKLPPENAVRITSSFQRLRDEIAERKPIAAVVEQNRRDGYKYLTVPTKSLIGQKVVFVAQLEFSHRHDKVFGYTAWTAWAGWQQAPLFVESTPKWPADQEGGVPVVVTGTLAERNDVPVFELVPGSPFRAGLPVPPGYDTQDIRTRYVVIDTKWEIVK